MGFSYKIIFLAILFILNCSLGMAQTCTESQGQPTINQTFGAGIRFLALMFQEQIIHLQMEVRLMDNIPLFIVPKGLMLLFGTKTLKIIARAKLTAISWP
jgi:hypothetical protein